MLLLIKLLYSSSDFLSLENNALEAVSGVLGVRTLDLYGGGVMVRSSNGVDPTVIAPVAIPGEASSGRSVKGGSRRPYALFDSPDCGF